jgi:hypothetical protein
MTITDRTTVGGTSGACGRCGVLRPADAPEGLCPKCLLGSALEDDLEEELDVEAADVVELPSLATTRRDTLEAPVAGAGEAHAEAKAGGYQREALKVGGYQLEALIARGGMGSVYRARQLGLDRTVALKICVGAGLASEADRARFQAEAHVVARLEHPNILPIHEVGAHWGIPYFTMPLLGGGSLGERVAEYASDPRAAAELLVTLARAVEHAHRRGVLHRDLKPANVLFDGEGRPFLTDFGLARALDGGQRLTRTGAILGTPAYLAPEQLDAGEHRPLTVAVDVYGLGAILYELLTGRPPFEGGRLEAVLEEVRHAEPARPSLRNQRVDRELETLCLKCLEKEPARRYPTAEAVAEELERWLRGEPLVALPVGAAERWGKWLKRRRAAAVVGSIALVAVALGLAGTLWQAGRAQEAQARLDESGYVNAIAQSERELRAGRVSRARDLLDAAAPTHRGWEWSYLRRRAGLARTDSDVEGILDAATSAGSAVVVRLGLTLPGAGGFSPDGARVALVGDGGAGEIVDASSGRSLARLQTAERPSGDGAAVHRPWLVWSDDGRLVAEASGRDRVDLWEAASGRRLWSTPPGPAPRRGGRAWAAPFFDPAGRLLVEHDGGGERWDPSTGRLELLGDRIPDVASELRWRGDSLGELIATVATGPARPTAEGLAASLWNALQRRGGELPAMFAPTVVFDPGGERFARVDERVEIERLRDFWRLFPEPPVVLEHGSPIHGAAFAPRGHRIASANGDGTVSLWDDVSGVELLSLPGHAGAALWVGFSPDGDRLASAGADGTLRIWDGTPPPAASHAGDAPRRHERPRAMGPILDALSRCRRGLETLQWALLVGWALVLVAQRIQAGRRIFTITARGALLAPALLFALSAWLALDAAGLHLPLWLAWMPQLARLCFGGGPAPIALLALWGLQCLDGFHVHQNGLYARGRLLKWAAIRSYGLIGSRLVCVIGRRRRTRGYAVPLERQAALAALLVRHAAGAGAGAPREPHPLAASVLRVAAVVGSIAAARLAWVALTLALLFRHHG